MIPHPFVGSNPWIALPRQVLRAFNGKGSLPIYELDKAKVQKPYGRVRPFPVSSGDMNFSAWRLAHAIKKADCLRQPSSQVLWTAAVGFLLENAHLFDWSAEELRLNEGMAASLADFSNSSLAGRIAQGMALLFLEEKGYVYVGRFEYEWKRRAANQSKSWPAGKKKAPDFIAENGKQEWVLAESKGGFASPASNPNIKGALSDGLKQLDGWDKLIAPQPIKSFAIGTFLRESGDVSEETSAIAFVDPEPEAPEGPVEFPVDAVRRANYASWLSLMDFEGVANRVRAGSGEPQRRSVPVIALGGREYAVSVLSVSPKQPDLSSREFWDDLREWPFFPFGWGRGGIRVELVGLDLDVLQILASASSSLGMSRLMELQPRQRGDAQRDAQIDYDGGAFFGSVFADGSLLGELRFSRSSRPFPEFRWIDVDL